jgi:hypothetical protein
VTTADLTLIVAGALLQVYTTLKKGKGVSASVEKKVDDAEAALMKTVLDHGVKITELTVAERATGKQLGHLDTRMGVTQSTLQELTKKVSELRKSVEEKKYLGPQIDTEEKTGKVELVDLPEQPIGKVIRKP